MLEEKRPVSLELKSRKFPFVLKFLTFVTGLFGLWVWAGVLEDIMVSARDGQIWKGFVSETPGFVYLVFNVAFKIFPGLLMTFFLVYSLAFLYWIHAKWMGLRAVPTDRDDGKFFDSRGFRLMSLFSIIFTGSGLIQAGFYAYAVFGGMISDTVVGPLILVLVGPLLAFVIFGFCVSLVVIGGLLVCCYWLAIRLLHWMRDYLLNFRQV